MKNFNLIYEALIKNITFSDVLSIINELKDNDNWKYHTSSGNCGIIAFMLNDLSPIKYPIGVVLSSGEDDEWWYGDPEVYHVVLILGKDNFLDGFGKVNGKQIQDFCINVYGDGDIKIDPFQYGELIKREIRNNTAFYTSEVDWLKFFKDYKYSENKELVLTKFLKKLDKLDSEE